jgi:hypothetical protein
MADEVQKLAAELDDIGQEVKTRFGSFTAEQLNWKASPETWSVGQCLDHLIKINSEYFPELDTIIRGERNQKFWETYSPFSGLFANLLYKSVSPEGERKLKAPKTATPSSSDISPAIVEDFEKHQVELAEKMRQTAGLDTKRIILTSPFLKLITYSLFDGYRIIVTHERRHLEQAKRVTQAEGFPATEDARGANV